VANILVCDDERSIRELLDIDLRKAGHKVETVSSPAEAKRKLDNALFDVIVTDIRMPSSFDGIDILQHASRVSPDSAIIVMTAGEEIEPAIEAVRARAFEYIL
jgi:DNA-binding NtrC family response regulator